MAMENPGVLAQAKRPKVVARPQTNVDREALRKSIMERFPKIRAELAK